MDGCAVDGFDGVFRGGGWVGEGVWWDGVVGVEAVGGGGRRGWWGGGGMEIERQMWLMKKESKSCLWRIENGLDSME